MCGWLQSDVDEALRLMRMSKISLSDEAGGRGVTDVVSAIYSRIRDDAGRQKQATYSWPQLTALFTGKDYTVCSQPWLPNHQPAELHLLFAIISACKSVCMAYMRGGAGGRVVPCGPQVMARKNFSAPKKILDR